MREIKFELGEITDDVIIYVDKYIKLLMSNVKYSFLEKYNAEQKLICNYIQIKENDATAANCRVAPPWMNSTL